MFILNKVLTKMWKNHLFTKNEFLLYLPYMIESIFLYFLFIMLQSSQHYLPLNIPVESHFSKNLIKDLQMYI